MKKHAHLINAAQVRPSSEIPGHSEVAPGQRVVFLDDRILPEASFYAAARVVRNLEGAPRGVELHRHTCDTTYMILGDNPDLTGLTVEIVLEDERYEVASPASVFIPQGLRHSANCLRGSGKLINIVPSARYNAAFVG